MGSFNKTRDSILFSFVNTLMNINVQNFLFRCTLELYKMKKRLFFQNDEESFGVDSKRPVNENGNKTQSANKSIVIGIAGE